MRSIMFFRNCGAWLRNTMGADAIGFVAYAPTDGGPSNSLLLVLPFGYWPE
jgi:hypothetical protein